MNDTTFHVGTSGCSHPEWKGSFYPKDLPAKRMLQFYSQRFAAVEMNGSFYRLPTASTVASWAADVPVGFRFAFKAPQRITHVQRLQNADESVAELLEVVGVAKEKAGPLLFQLPPNFKKDVLRPSRFLALLPAGCRAAFEFRHASWMDKEVFDLLSDRQAALCVAEADDGVETPLVRTADWAYVRLRLVDYSDAQLSAWVDRVRQHGWREAFVFFKHEDEGNGPRFADRLLRLVSRPSS